MSQVFMTLANKGLVEFSVTQDRRRDQRIIRVSYRVYTPCDADAVRWEFRRAIAAALGYVVDDEEQANGLNCLSLVPAQPDEWTSEIMAG